MLGGGGRVNVVFSRFSFFNVRADRQTCLGGVTLRAYVGFVNEAVSRSSFHFVGSNGQRLSS